MKRLSRVISLFVLTLLKCHGLYAAERVAILNFELNDITSLPNTPAELKRTASMAPLLSQAISNMGGYEIVAVDEATFKSANAGFGYLFRFHDLAAQLGQQLGVEWIIVGRHSKPSFLYSYLMAHLIEVKSQTLSASFDIELKGNHETVTQHGIDRLADKINDAVKKPIR